MVPYSPSTLHIPPMEFNDSAKNKCKFIAPVFGVKWTRYGNSPREFRLLMSSNDLGIVIQLMNLILIASGRNGERLLQRPRDTLELLRTRLLAVTLESAFQCSNVVSKGSTVLKIQLENLMSMSKLSSDLPVLLSQLLLALAQARVAPISYSTTRFT